MTNCPLETYEQEHFVNWLKIKRLTHSSIPNSTFTRSWKQKAKNKREGLNPGLPDLLVIIPKERSNKKKALMVFIEMKRVKGGVLSEHQKEWIEEINKVENVGAYVAKGAYEAISIIKSFLY
jgi:hypothetical protein